MLRCAQNKLKSTIFPTKRLFPEGLHASISSGRRLISSATTNGFQWFNSSEACPARTNCNYSTLITLGTSSGAPTRYRNVTSNVWLSFTGQVARAYLFDAGEGTQVQLKANAVVPLGKIRAIFITHLHGDHLNGLPGVIVSILSSLSYSWRDDGVSTKGTYPSTAFGEPSGPDRLSIFGPVGLHKYLSGVFPTYWPSLLEAMPIDVFELVPSNWSRAAPQGGVGKHSYLFPDSSGAYTLISDDTHNVRAAPITHSVPCFGYVVTEHGRSNLDVRALTALGVPPGPVYKELQQGHAIVGPDGRTIRPEDVSFPGVLPLRIVVLGDNSDASAMLPLAVGADLIVHEATLKPGFESVARQRGHSTAAMAGAFARQCGAQRLLLTHFGASLCCSYEDAALDALGRRDVEAAVVKAARARGRRGGAVVTPGVYSRDVMWDCILETERRVDDAIHANRVPDAVVDRQGGKEGGAAGAAPVAPVGSSSQSSPDGRPGAPPGSEDEVATTVLANYDDWLARRDHSFGREISLRRYSFPPCRHWLSPDSMALERAAQEAFGSPQVLFARDHLAVVLRGSGDRAVACAPSRDTPPSTVQ